MHTKFSKSEITDLRECANEAWESELHDALAGLFEEFSCWADDGYSSRELAESLSEILCVRHNMLLRSMYAKQDEQEETGSGAA